MTGGVSTRSTNRSTDTDSVDTDSDEEDGVNGESEEIVAEEVQPEELTEESLLFGYVHDNNYNPQDMEEDGSYDEDLEWEYDEVPTEDLTPAVYNGEGPALRQGVSNKFKTVLEACSVAGGLSYDLIKRITAHTNASVRSKLIGYSFYGKEWRNIRVEEMYWTLGMILKMSLINFHFGGIKNYFVPLKRVYPTSQGVDVLGLNTTEWYNRRFSYGRFIQIRAALRPEFGDSNISDKCHQLRTAINYLNNHAKKCFIPGRFLSFDEGGIANKSKYNPVRQYNASKPDKYRIDFFVLANAVSGNNFVYHLDIYQGKNQTNAFIAREAWNLPTTQKAVVNAIISSGLVNDPDGSRELYMDNRYTSPALFILLREKYGILACGTIRSNRKGWNAEVMNLKKTAPRGSSILKYDPTNKLLFGQWNDNKVVSFISTLGIFGKSTIQRRVGPDKVDYDIPTALKLYTKDNYMGGVDNLDKDKCIGGSFTGRAMFKKWYRMGLMGIFDFMVVNGRQAWNMSGMEHEDRFAMTNGMFRLCLAEEFLKFKDESGVNIEAEESLCQTARMMAGHNMIAAESKRGRLFCCVCNLEKQFRLSANSRNSEKWKTYYSTSNIVGCANKGCTLHAHSVKVQSDGFIFQDIAFENLTCFQIAHHPKTAGLWASNKSFRYKPAGVDNRRPHEKKAYTVMTTHPLYISLRKKYGLNLKRRKPAEDNASSDGEESDDDVEEYLEDDDSEDQPRKKRSSV
jgi:hypothetical protein